MCIYTSLSLSLYLSLHRLMSGSVATERMTKTKLQKSRASTALFSAFGSQSTSVDQQTWLLQLTDSCTRHIRNGPAEKWRNQRCPSVSGPKAATKINGIVNMLPKPHQICANLCLSVTMWATQSKTVPIFETTSCVLLFYKVSKR